MSERSSDGSRLLVAVPLYRQPQLLAPLAAALAALADELAALGASVLLIDDSPDDAALAEALDRVLPILAASVPVELVRNPANLGFVRSANVALARGRDTGRDVLLLNSDALPRPGAFAEMVAVAAIDPMTAVVNPRSDNATLCNSPVIDALRRDGAERAYAAHRAIEPLLPRVSYVPTAVGFCLLIRHAMLREFGLFDEIYGRGYNEENDFVLRCNRRGYRALIANHAYVHHLGGISFAGAGDPAAWHEEDNRETLLERYPEYETAIARWFDGADYRAQRLLSGLVPGVDGRLSLLIDCTALEPSFNGTCEHIRALVTAFVGRHAGRYDIAALGDADAFRFHGLDRLDGLRRLEPAEARGRPAALVLRIGQPFAPEDLAAIADTAALTAVIMFDTIAMDCQQLDDVGLEALWAMMVDTVDAIGFNSRFSLDQFGRRFAVPERVVQFVTRCSTDPADYAPDIVDGDGAGDGILLVGNHYPHKYVRETLAMLRAAAPDQRVTVLGLALDPEPGVTVHVAGELPQPVIDDLYAAARVVLFPSHYEGFGLPIMHALARRRPVIARDLPSAREIRALSPDGDNLHLVGSTAEMIALACDPPCWRDRPAPPAMAPPGWAAAADAVADAVAQAIARFDFAVCRRRQQPVAAASDAGRWTRAATIRGSGFMFGDMIETVTGPAEPGGAPGIVLTASLEARGDVEIAAELLDRLRDRVAGDAVTLALDAADAEAAGVIAAAMLVACGCALGTVERGARRAVAYGRLRHRWLDLVACPADDAGFVRHVYRQALGRNPDPAGGRNYVAELGDGLPRDRMLRLFLASGERRDKIAGQLRRRGLLG